MKGFLTRVATRGRRSHEASVAHRGGRSRSPIAEIDQRVGMPGFERLGTVAGSVPAGLSGAPDESAGPRGSEAGAPLPGTMDPAPGGRGQARPSGGPRVGAGRADDDHTPGRATRPRHTGGQPGFPPAQEPDAGPANRAPGEQSAGGGREPLHSPARDHPTGRSRGESASAGDLEIEIAHDASRPEPPGELPVRDSRAALVRTFEPAPRPHRDDAAHPTSNGTNGASADHHGAEPLVEDDGAAPGEVATIREVHHHHHHDRDDRSEHERAAAERTAPPARPAPVTAASVSVIGPLTAGRRSNLRFALRQR